MVNPGLCCVCQEILKDEDPEQICRSCFRKASIPGSADALIDLGRKGPIIFRGIARLQIWMADMYAAAATRLEFEGGPIPNLDREPYRTIAEITKELREST